MRNQQPFLLGARDIVKRGQTDTTNSWVTMRSLNGKLTSSVADWEKDAKDTIIYMTPEGRLRRILSGFAEVFMKRISIIALFMVLISNIFGVVLADDILSLDTDPTLERSISFTDFQATVTVIPISALNELEIEIENLIGLMIFELPPDWSRVDFEYISVSGRCRRGQPIEDSWADLFLIGDGSIVQTVRYNPLIVVSSGRLVLALSAYIDTGSRYSLSLNSSRGSAYWEFDAGQKSFH